MDSLGSSAFFSTGVSAGLLYVVLLPNNYYPESLTKGYGGFGNKKGLSGLL